MAQLRTLSAIMESNLKNWSLTFATLLMWFAAVSFLTANVIAIIPFTVPFFLSAYLPELLGLLVAVLIKFL